MNAVRPLPQRTDAVHAAPPGQQVYVTVDTGGHMASPAHLYFEQVRVFRGAPRGRKSVAEFKD